MTVFNLPTIVATSLADGVPLLAMVDVALGVPGVVSTIGLIVATVSPDAPPAEEPTVASVDPDVPQSGPLFNAPRIWAEYTLNCVRV